jgi:hypothetical protein
VLDIFGNFQVVDPNDLVTFSSADGKDTFIIRVPSSGLDRAGKIFTFIEIWLKVLVKSVGQIRQPPYC